MKFDIRFKGIEHSEGLAVYAQERLERLEKYELKPIKVNVTFSAERHQKCAEAYIQGLQCSFRAKAKGENFHDCLEDLCRKLSKQMSKEKGKIQHHRHAEQTQLARLERRIQDEKKSA